MQAVLIPLAIIGIFALFFVVIIISTFNGIVENGNRIRRAWSDVLVHERQKTNILDELQTQVKGYKEYEGELMAKITGLRSQIAALSDTPDHAGLSAVQSSTKDLVGGLRVAFEAYPNLQAGDILKGLMREITEQEENVGAAIKIYNSAVEYFNNSIQTFFGSWVNNKWNRKSAAESFTDTKAASNIEFQPTLP